jgi:hypothetical protein
MKNRSVFVLCVLVFVFAACSGSSQTETAPALERSDATVMPTAIQTFTPLPSDTPLPTATITAAPSITPTLTVTPENFVLAESGSDIADVRISYPREDIAVIDFDYRIDARGKRSDQQIVILLLLPNSCGYDSNSSIPTIGVGSTPGHGRLTYKQIAQGQCDVPYFDLAIKYSFQAPGSRILTDVYQERINQPLAVVRNFPAVSSQNLTVKNFSFETTGAWSGKFSFDYSFLPEIPVANEKYRFALSGMGGIFVCEFHAWGPVIKEAEGHYTINIDFYSTQDFRITDQTCMTRYDALSYDVSLLNLEDLLTNNPVRIYHRAIDLVITLKRSP